MISEIIPRFKFPSQWLGIFVAFNLFNVALVNSAMAQPESLRTLIVTGNSTEKISTTIAEIRLGVEISSKTAAEVQQEIARRTSAIVDLLRSKEVEQLQTTGVRLNPNYAQLERNNNQRVIASYTGTNIVGFRIPSEQVGSLLDEAVEAGASRIDGISFTATTAAISTAKKEALRKATSDAQDQAEVVLETLNLTSDGIINIQLDQASMNQPQPFASRQFSVSESRVSTPIIGGEQTVEASVTLQISY